MISAWFAPRVTVEFSRAWWRWRHPFRGLIVFGGCLFWLFAWYAWIAYKVVQAALWVAGVALIWTAQVAVLPLVAIQLWSAHTNVYAHAGDDHDSGDEP